MPAAPAALPASHRRYLRGLAHQLKPIILVGSKGVTEALVAELDGALERQELVKVKVAAEDRDARDALVAKLAVEARAAPVQRIGNTLTLYRRSQESPKIVLPRA